MIKKKSPARRKSASTNKGSVGKIVTTGAKKSKTAIQGSIVAFGTKPKGPALELALVKLGFADKSKEKARADVASNLGATQSLRALLKSTGWS